MKKSQLYISISYAMFGITCIVIAALNEFKLEGILWGLSGVGVGSGFVLTWKYLYWSKPNNKNQYEEKIEQERIEMSDERKNMLRDKSGRITYRIMCAVYCILILVFSTVSTLGYFNPFSKYVVIGLVTLLVFQYICGILAFNNLNKRL